MTQAALSRPVGSQFTNFWRNIWDFNKKSSGSGSKYMILKLISDTVSKLSTAGCQSWLTPYLDYFNSDNSPKKNIDSTILLCHKSSEQQLSETLSPPTIDDLWLVSAVALAPSAIPVLISVSWSHKSGIASVQASHWSILWQLWPLIGCWVSHNPRKAHHNDYLSTKNQTSVFLFWTHFTGRRILISCLLFKVQTRRRGAGGCLHSRTEFN